MRKLLLILLCIPLIGFSQNIPTVIAESINAWWDYDDLIDWNIIETDLEHESFNECFCTYPLNCFNSSSSLPSQGNNYYGVDNISDDDPRTAWVEGVDGYGIGESFMVKVDSSARHPIYILNGYQKNINTWIQNSRVKKFKVYFESSDFSRDSDVKTIYDFPICFLILEDKMGYQIINFNDAIDIWIKEMDLDKIDPLMAGFSYDNEGVFQDYILRFEIVEVYKGDRWEDVAISGIYYSENCCSEAR